MEPPPAFSNAPPVQDEGLGPLNGQQPEAKAPNRSINDIPHEEDDVRNKAPKNWDEVMKIQQVLEAVIRTFARVTARPPPITSPYSSYRHQRAVFQRASDHYSRLEGRQGPPPELAGLGAWQGPIMSITNAPVDITEEDLEPHVHPSVAACCEKEGMRSQRSLSFQCSAMQSYDTPP